MQAVVSGPETLQVSCVLRPAKGHLQSLGTQLAHRRCTSDCRPRGVTTVEHVRVVVTLTRVHGTFGHYIYCFLHLLRHMGREGRSAKSADHPRRRLHERERQKAVLPRTSFRH